MMTLNAPERLAPTLKQSKSRCAYPEEMAKKGKMKKIATWKKKRKSHTK